MDPAYVCCGSDNLLRTMLPKPPRLRVARGALARGERTEREAAGAGASTVDSGHRLTALLRFNGTTPIGPWNLLNVEENIRYSSHSSSTGPFLEDAGAVGLRAKLWAKAVPSLCCNELRKGQALKACCTKVSILKYWYLRNLRRQTSIPHTIFTLTWPGET